MSIEFIPCEQCVKMFALDVKPSVKPGRDVDHIDPLNPNNAIDSKDWGDPFNEDNLQYLCTSHHTKKTNRDKQIIKIKNREK